MRRAIERCGDCAPGKQCSYHAACASQPDAALASQIGAAWARFVRSQVDVRRPWPPFDDRCAAIAARLVAALALTEARRAELARIAHWRAGLVWESLQLPGLRDRPYEHPGGLGTIVELPGALRIHFRTRRAGATRPTRIAHLRSRNLMSVYAVSMSPASAVRSTSRPDPSFTWRPRLPVPSSKPAGSSSNAPKKKPTLT